MRLDTGKLLIGALGVLFLAPVAYSVIMAFIPENDKSLITHSPQTSSMSGAELYSKCAPCHGDNGDGTDAYPSLNTLTKERLIEMLVGYQNGSYGTINNKKIMQVQVQGMSRGDMEKLADFVTNLKPRQKNVDEQKKKEQKKKEQQIDITGISS